MSKFVKFLLVLIGPFLLAYTEVHVRTPEGKDTTAAVREYFINLGATGFNTLFCNAPVTIDKNTEIYPDRLGLGTVTTESITHYINLPGTRHSVSVGRVISMYEIAKLLPCGKDVKSVGDLKVCTQQSKTFIQIESDPVNYYPVLTTINDYRGTYLLAQEPKPVKGSPLGTCLMKTDPRTTEIYIPDVAKGYVAKVYDYLAKKYKLNLPNKQKEMIKNWLANYPLTAEQTKIFNDMVELSKEHALK